MVSFMQSDAEGRRKLRVDHGSQRLRTLLPSGLSFSLIRMSRGGKQASLDSVCSLT